MVICKYHGCHFFNLNNAVEHMIHCRSSMFRYRGTYRSQDVAIKILKAERLNTELQKEFAQEVYILRFVDIKH